MKNTFSAACLLAAALAACGKPASQDAASEWSVAELAAIESLWIGRLGPPPPDPANAHVDDPQATALGERLFNDTHLSANGQVACATCHAPQRDFTDGLPRSKGVGSARRNAPSLLTAAYFTWLFWDGRADSLWSQALFPIESPVEQGLPRVALAQAVARNDRDDYERIFGALPDFSDRKRFPPQATPAGDEPARAAWAAMAASDRAAVNRVAANAGKALEAYERRLRPEPSRFDAYVEALHKKNASADKILTASERMGLRLFIGRGQCLRCHNGPLLSNGQFHNTGLPPLPGAAPDFGRAEGIGTVMASEFNCRGPYSDRKPPDCPHLDYLRVNAPEWVAAFRTPSLRNVAATGPYMHDGRFATLRAVLEHYNRAPQAPLRYGHTELFPLGLTDRELDELEAFLLALSGSR